ncbi:hypothetical protein GOM71_07265 [Paenibacillus sp. NEAU-GSW1]|nr:hypothetical protein [Paenibacillus sp. NEAU-GSW1]
MELITRKHVISKEMVHDGLTVIDAGINETADGKIVGDAAADTNGTAYAVSPIPGGVGTPTTAILYENVIKAISIPYKEACPR